MATKPESFEKSKIWEEEISPEEIATWVDYVRQVALEKILKNEPKLSLEISEEDISVQVETYMFPKRYIGGLISVETSYGGMYKNVTKIAAFREGKVARDTFLNYSKYVAKK